MDIKLIFMLISAVIFLLTYVLIISEKVDRTIAALSGASLMLLFKILSQERAFLEIDYNTIGLLISMMIVVMITKKTGIFEYLAIRIVKIAKGRPAIIFVLLSLVTGILSALLDNVTTILLVIPLTFDITKSLGINPLPLIISEVFASNVGGTATLIGDPPNIMISGPAGLSFMDFVVNTGRIAIPLLILTTFLFMLIYRKSLVTTQEAMDKVMGMDERQAIKDKQLLIKSLSVLVMIIIGFSLHGLLHYESATISIAGAVLLLLLSGIKPEKVMDEVEWSTIFFFAGLFILVGGIKETGLIKMLAEGVLGITGGNLRFTALSILWLSSLASSFVDNIPFVATMIPMIKDIGSISGMDISSLWWALSLGACLGGNGTLIGASANVIASGMAEEYGLKITFGGFFKAAFPMMLLTIVISTVYLYLFYLI